MPRFYFDMRYGSEEVADTMGSELESEAVAYREARATIGEMARDLLVRDGGAVSLGIAARSEAGDILFRISLECRMDAER